MIARLQGENRDLNNKYLKKKSKRVGHKYLGAHRWISQVETWPGKISQAESVHFASWILWFRSLRNCLSTWCGCLPMDITSSFQLRFAHRLKHWTSDFLIFEKKYSLHKMDFRKWSKCVLRLLSSWISSC